MEKVSVDKQHIDAVMKSIELGIAVSIEKETENAFIISGDGTSLFNCGQIVGYEHLRKEIEE